MKVLSFRVPERTVFGINSFRPSIGRCLLFSYLLAWSIPICLGLMRSVGLPQLYPSDPSGVVEFMPLDLIESDSWYRVWFGVNLMIHNSIVYLIELTYFLMAYMGISFIQRHGNKKEKFSDDDFERITFTHKACALGLSLFVIVFSYGRYGVIGSLSWSQFSTLILPHGIFELFASIIPLSLFVYFVTRWSWSSRRDDLENVWFLLRSKMALKLVLLGFFLLFVAGLTEGIISPGLYENIYHGGKELMPGKIF